MIVHRLILAASIFLLTACSTFAKDNTSQQNSAALIYTAAAATEKAIPPSQNPSESTLPASPEPLPEPSATASYRASVPVSADLVNLRAGPGTFFKTLYPLTKGMQLTAVGMVADGSWIQVEAFQAEGSMLSGWVFATLLDLSSIEVSLPIIEWPPESTIAGTITDTEGNSINAVRVAVSITQENTQLRDEGLSNRDGDFFIYLPSALSGPFNLEIVAVNCSSTISKIQADGSCRVLDYFPLVWRTSISLPLTASVQFSYERGLSFLEGKVIYQDGNGASQILVRATRLTDGAQSEYVTLQGGDYRIPLGLGTWEIVAIRFLADGTPLTSETRRLEITTTGQVIEPLLISYTEIIER